MTYGSACGGEGCLQRDAGVKAIDAAGEMLLAGVPDRLVEYRRDGVDLGRAPADTSGLVRAGGERATVVLPRLLSGSAAAVDAVESDVASRINAQRSARGLSLATLNMRLSSAADLQATWLSRSAAGLGLPCWSPMKVRPAAPCPFALARCRFPSPRSAARSRQPVRRPRKRSRAGWPPRPTARRCSRPAGC